MSRLTDLIAHAKAKDPQLGADLDREFKVLSSRLPFGLNFERHRPEAWNCLSAPSARATRCACYRRAALPRKATRGFGG